MAPSPPWTPLTDAGRSEPRLLDRVRLAVRARHYSLRTEEAYVAWVRRFVLFHGKRRTPAKWARNRSTSFYHLVVRHRVGASTQNQALAAILFLYRHVLEKPLPTPEGLVRARRTRHLPSVLTRAEVRAVIGSLTGAPKLVSALLYSSGLEDGYDIRTIQELLGHKDLKNPDDLHPRPQPIRRPWRAKPRRRAVEARFYELARN